MTREEATKEIEHTVECCKAYLTEYDPWILALNIAISALRAQQTPAKLDRSRWEGCYSCGNVLKKSRMVKLGRNYCPRCGHPLTEAAWAELESRINGKELD